MTSLARRAGRGRVANLGSVIWSVAEGSRGRRWREVRRDGRGVVVSSLLYETHPDGRFAHTELSTARGLLTLHPEPDGTLHGNIVAEDGISHVRGLPWPEPSILIVDGSPTSAAAALGRFRSAGVHAATDVTVVRVDLDLELTSGRETVRQSPDGTSQIGNDAAIVLDDDGLPRLDDGEGWPLEPA
jgi:hypothetical protein